MGGEGLKSLKMKRKGERRKSKKKGEEKMKDGKTESDHQFPAHVDRIIEKAFIDRRKKG